MNKTTEQMRMQTIREKLREKCDAGMLGVIAARARVAEAELRAWCADAAKVPSTSVVSDVAHTLAQDHYRQEARVALNYPGVDPYNSVDTCHCGVPFCCGICGDDDHDETSHAS